MHISKSALSNSVLAPQCYKCAKDLQPLLELSLPGCQVVYKSKHSKKMQHELKVTAGSDSVVMGFQSYEQAEEWRKVWRCLQYNRPITTERHRGQLCG